MLWGGKLFYYGAAAAATCSEKGRSVSRRDWSIPEVRNEGEKCY